MSQQKSHLQIVETPEPYPLTEKLKAHYRLALQADSLAELLDKSDLFDWLVQSEAGAVHGSLELLFELVTKMRENADDLLCKNS